MMPGIDGYEVCRRLKADPDTRGAPVIFITANDDAESLVKGFQAGGVDYVGKPFRDEEVVMRVRTHLEIARLNRELKRGIQALQEKNSQLEKEIALRRLMKTQLSDMAERDALSWGLDGLIARSATMKTVMDQVRTAQEDSGGGAVIIHGAAGTGKELLARAIHYGSPRSGGPFVQLSCSDLPQDVMTSISSRTEALSMLFGHVVGAFQEATEDREGHYQLAAGGTLYLSGIDAMPVPLQAGLVRAMETGSANRLGETMSLPVDVRVIAGSNFDLPQLVADELLHDGLQRRFTHEIALPSLCDRREDIPDLARYFATRAARLLGVPEPEVTVAAKEMTS
jgi:DNA-binding NtrC family response regulator